MNTSCYQLHGFLIFSGLYIAHTCNNIICFGPSKSRQLKLNQYVLSRKGKYLLLCSADAIKKLIIYCLMRCVQNHVSHVKSLANGLGVE